MVIRSPRNETVKDMRRLRRSKGDHALLEGPHLLAEALTAEVPLSSVLMTPQFLSTSQGLDLARRLPRPPLTVEARLLEGLMDADSPRGALAVARLPRGGVPTLPAEGRRFVYVAGLQDPGNLGALARVAEATGVAGLALAPGTVHPNHPRALRASAGSLLRLPVAMGIERPELDAHLQQQDPLSWIALSAHGGTSLYEASFPQRVVLMLGAEGPGLEAEVEEAADQRITIPLAPPVESLNATVAAAVVLFELRRQDT